MESPTKQEIDNSKILKITKKFMKDEFPWILNLEAKHDNPYHSLMFLSANINPIMMAEDLGVEIRPYVLKHSSNPEWNKYGALCVMTEESCSDPKVKAIEENLDRHINAAVLSAAVPKEFKEILGGRKFSLNQFVIEHSTLWSQP